MQSESEYFRVKIYIKVTSGVFYISKIAASVIDAIFVKGFIVTPKIRVQIQILSLTHIHSGQIFPELEQRSINGRKKVDKT